MSLTAKHFVELRHPRGAANGASAKDAPTEHISVMTITPDRAASWLAAGGKNRNVSDRRVRQYAAAMKRGEWRLTYEAIKLDDNGLVRDGQHRLHAIVESKCEIQALVVYGVDEAAFDVMDTGRNRTVGDVLSIHDVARSDAVSGVVRFLLIWEMDHRRGVYGANTPSLSAPQTLAYLQAHPDVADWLDVASSITKANVRGGRNLWAGLLTLFGRISRDEAAEFADRVISGANLAPGSPILTLRKQLINMPGAHTRVTNNRTACWIIKAWNAYRKGIHVYQLKWGQDEAFPEPE